MNPLRFDAIRTCAILVALMVAYGAGAATNVQYRILVRDGDPVPGVVDATFVTFSAPVLNRHSEVFFGARITGGDAATSNDFVLVAGRPGAWSYVARESDHVAGLPPDVYLDPGAKPFTNLRLNDAGYLAFVSQLDGAGVSNANDSCFIWGKPGELQVIAREGDLVPGATDGETFADLAQLQGLKLVLGASNEVGFVSQWRSVAHPGGYAGLWLGPATNLSLLAQDGQAAPDFPGQTMTTMLFSTARLNPAGGITFAGKTSASPLNEAIWAGTTQGLRAVWREGDVIPRTTLAFRSFTAPTVNVHTQFCFVAGLSGVPFDTDRVIVAGTETNLQIVAREGSQAPGMPPDVVFNELAAVEPLFTASGDVAFTATVSGPGIGTTNGTAVWVGKPGALRVLSRRGNPAADMPEGVVYSTLLGVTFSLAGINDSGDVVFTSKVEGPGVGVNNDTGLWGGRPGFESLLLQRGDAVDLGDGQSNAVHMIDIVDIGGQLQTGGGQDGRARSLNDFAQYVVSVNFKASQGSAIVMIDNVEDTDRNGLSRVLERAHGIPIGGSATRARLSLTREGDALALRFQEAVDVGSVALGLQEADALDGPWSLVVVPVYNALDQSGVDAGAVRLEALAPMNARSRFFRLDAVVQEGAP